MCGLHFGFPERLLLILNNPSLGQACALPFFFPRIQHYRGYAEDGLSLTLISPTFNKPEGIGNCREQQAAIT